VTARLALTAVAVSAALAAGVLIGWMVRPDAEPAASPARSVVVEVSGTRPDPIDTCVVLPSICKSTAVTSIPAPTPPPPRAELTLTTPSGQTRTSEMLPYQNRLTVPAGAGDVLVSAWADDTETLTCAISVDGREVARQQVERGIVTCRATP
jgi:hypothetical protein